MLEIAWFGFGKIGRAVSSQLSINFFDDFIKTLHIDQVHDLIFNQHPKIL